MARVSAFLMIAFITMVLLCVLSSASPLNILQQQQQEQLEDDLPAQVGVPIPDGTLQIGVSGLTTILPTPDRKPMLRVGVNGLVAEYDEYYNGFEYDFEFQLNGVKPVKNQCFVTLTLGNLLDLDLSARFTIDVRPDWWSNSTRITFPSKRDSYDAYDDEKPDEIKTQLQMYIYCEIESYDDVTKEYYVDAKLTSVKSKKVFKSHFDSYRNFLIPLSETPLKLNFPKPVSGKPAYKPFSFTVSDIKTEGLKYLQMNLQGDRGGAWSTTQVDWFATSEAYKTKPNCTLNGKNIPVLVSIFTVHDIEFLVDNMLAEDRPKTDVPWVFDCTHVHMREIEKGTNLRVKFMTVNWKPRELYSIEYLQVAPNPGPSPGPKHKPTQVEIWKTRAKIAIGFAVVLGVVAVAFAVAFFCKKPRGENNTDSYGSLNV